MIRSVQEIVNISESKSTPDRMAYKYLIRQVDKLLRSRALDQQYDAMFEVPAMVLFQPHFNRGFVAKKLVNHYRKRGFNCEMDLFTIKLEWAKLDSGNDDADDENVSEPESNSEDDDRLPPQEGEVELSILPPPRKIVVQASRSLVSRVEAMKIRDELSQNV